MKRILLYGRKLRSGVLGTLFALVTLITFSVSELNGQDCTTANFVVEGTDSQCRNAATIKVTIAKDTCAEWDKVEVTKPSDVNFSDRKEVAIQNADGSRSYLFEGMDSGEFVVKLAKGSGNNYVTLDEQAVSVTVNNVYVTMNVNTPQVVAPVCKGGTTSATVSFKENTGTGPFVFMIFPEGTSVEQTTGTPIAQSGEQMTRTYTFDNLESNTNYDVWIVDKGAESSCGGTFREKIDVEVPLHYIKGFNDLRPVFLENNCLDNACDFIPHFWIGLSWSGDRNFTLEAEFTQKLIENSYYTINGGSEKYKIELDGSLQPYFRGVKNVNIGDKLVLYVYDGGCSGNELIKKDFGTIVEPDIKVISGAKVCGEPASISIDARSSNSATIIGAACNTNTVTITEVVSGNTVYEEKDLILHYDSYNSARNPNGYTPNWQGKISGDFLEEGKTYEVTVKDDICGRTYTKTLGIAKDTFDFCALVDKTVSEGISIANETGAIGLYPNKEWLDNARLPLKIRIDRIKSGKIVKGTELYYTSGPDEYEGNHTITFPIEISDVKTNGFTILDLPKGDYRVTITDNCGTTCHKDLTLQATTFRKPKVNVTPICGGSKVNFEMQSTGIKNGLFDGRLSFSQKNGGNIGGLSGNGAQIRGVQNVGMISREIPNVTPGEYRYFYSFIEGQVYSPIVAAEGLKAGYFTVENPSSPPAFDFKIYCSDTDDTPNVFVTTKTLPALPLYYVLNKLQEDGSKIQISRSPEISDPNNFGYTFNDVEEGKYEVQIELACGTYPHNIVVDNNVKPEVEAYSTPKLLCPQSTRLVTLRTNMPEAAFTITWYDDSGTEVGTGTQVQVQPAIDIPYGSNIEKTYTVVISNVQGCDANTELRATTTVKINDNSLPEITLPQVETSYDLLSGCTRSLTFEATALDECPGVSSLTYHLDYVSETNTGTDISTEITGAEGYAFPLGVTVVTVRAEDANGNVLTENFTVNILDKIQPTITAFTIADLELPTDACEVSAIFKTAADDNCPDGLSIKYVLSNETQGTTVGTQTVASNTDVTFANLSVGSYKVVATPIDGSGNNGSPTEATFTVSDNILPVAATIAVSDTNIISNCSVDVPVRVTGTDNCEVSSITYTLKNTATGLQVGTVATVTATANEATHTFTSLAPGTYEVSSKVIDKYGNESANIVSKTFTVSDVTKPLIRITEANNVVVDTNCKADELIKVTATDNCSVASIVYTLSKKSGATYEEVSNYTSTVSGSSVNDTYTLTNLEKGEYQVRVKAADVNGVESEEAMREFTVSDNIAPTISSITVPNAEVTDACTASAEVTIEAADNCGEISKVIYTLSKDGVAESPVEATTLTHTFTDLAPGSYTVKAVVYDSSNNASAASTKTFTVSDNILPVATEITVGDVFECSKFEVSVSGTDNCELKETTFTLTNLSTSAIVSTLTKATTGNKATHIYTLEVGTNYKVEATVTDIYGNVSEKSVSTTIDVAPKPTITGSNVVNVGSEIELTATEIPANSDAWTLNKTGVVNLVSSGTTATLTGISVGTVVVTYTNNAGCQVTHTVKVELSELIANNDNMGSVTGATTSTTTNTVFDNDTLNGVAVNPADLNFTPGVFPTTATGGITLNTDGTVTVKANTPAGTYTTTYTICEKLNPTNCDEATVSIVVEAGELVANNDTMGSVIGTTESKTAKTVFDNDTLNGAAVNPADLNFTPGAFPTTATGGITLNADGTVTVKANTPAGTYTTTYTICEKLNPTNCDEATVSIVVEAGKLVANDDTMGSVTGATTSTTTKTVFDNDTLNGVAVNPADLNFTPGTFPATTTGGITLNTDGTVTVKADTPAGTYTTTYTICETLNPTNCKDATVSIEVEAGELVANNDTMDSVIGTTASTTTKTVFDNDTLNGVAVNPDDLNFTPGTFPATTTGGITLNTDGTVTVKADTPAGTYTTTYTICETLNPTNCDEATVSIEVEAGELVANNDTMDSVIGTTASTTTKTVFDNDTLNGVAVNPDDLNFTPGTFPATTTGGITLNADGTVTVKANTPAGTYTTTYTICEKLNPTNCDEATVSIVVEAGNLIANNDDMGSVTGATTSTTTKTVFDNDTLNGAAVNPADLNFTPGVFPSTSTGGVVLNPEGTVTVKANTPAGTYTTTYTICEKLNPTNCDEATVSIVVEAGNLIANNDDMGSVTGATTSTTTNTVFDNDTLNGVAVNPDDLNFTPGAFPTTATGGITLNTDGTVTVKANTLAGTYTTTYTICEKLNPDNCKEAEVVIVVEAGNLIANNDDMGSVTGATTNTTTNTVFDNDTLNGVAVNPDDLNFTPGTFPATTTGGITLNTDGTVTVKADTPAGTYTTTYTICETLNPTNCDEATVSIVVEAGNLIANNDDMGSVTGATTSTTTNTVFDNDTLNGVAVNPDDLNFTPGAFPTTTTGGVILNTDGTVTVKANTPAGTYTTTYTICETLNPTNCKDATVSIEVEAGELVANNDTMDSVIGTTASTTTKTVFDNDTLNGVAVNPDDLNFTPGAFPTTTTGGVILNTDGTVTVKANTPAGTYTTTYTICEKLNPTNCKDATVSIVVEAGKLVASDDTMEPVTGTTTSTTTNTVFDNDTLNGVAVNPDDLNFTPGAFPTTTTGGVVLNTDGTVTVKANTPAGTYTATYTICEKLNPDNCKEAEVVIVVEAGNLIANNDDMGSVTGATTSTTTNTVFDNDTLNGVAVNPDDLNFTPGAFPTTATGGITLNTDGTVTVKADTPAGTYTTTYTICEKLNPDNCKEAEISIVVENTPPIAVDDNATTTINNSIDIDVLANDTDSDGSLDRSSVKVKQLPTNGEVRVNTDGTITYIPNELFKGLDTFTYEVCDDGGECANAKVFVKVECPSFGDDISIPQFISPNGDGKNDSWDIKELAERGICSQNNSVRIFNRWGAQVYSKRNYMRDEERFTGYSNNRLDFSGNRLLPSGTYFYIIEIDNKIERTGYLYISGE